MRHATLRLYANSNWVTNEPWPRQEALSSFEQILFEDEATDSHRFSNRFSNSAFQTGLHKVSYPVDQDAG